MYIYIFIHKFISHTKKNIFFLTAKAVSPFIPKNLANFIVENYVAMRENDLRNSNENGEKGIYNK